MSAKPGEQSLSFAAGTPEDLAAVIGTIFFISGWITLMQTIVGDRLPIIQVCAYINAVVPLFESRLVKAITHQQSRWGLGME